MCVQDEIKKEDCNEVYSCTLIYANLHADKDLIMTYGKGIIFVSMKEIQTGTVHILNDAKNSHSKFHYA